MNLAKLSAALGMCVITIAEFSQRANISIADAKTEIDAGRLKLIRIGNDACIESDEAFRWIKARHGAAAPCFWRPLSNDGRKINPFADAPPPAPVPLSTLAL